MSNPILALIPSGQKATKVYSVLPNDGSGDFTFDRDTIAKRVRQDEMDLLKKLQLTYQDLTG
jgi:hypothetical protein